MNHSPLTSPGILIEQGINLANQGRLPEALAIYHNLVPLATNDAEVLARFGGLCLLLDKAAEAIEVCSKAVAMAPDSSSVLIALGQAHIVRQQYQAAEHFLLRALQQDKQNPALLIQLGSVQNAMGRHVEAQTTLEHLLDIKPSTPDLYRQLAICYSTTNQLEKARQFATRAVQKSPRDAEVCYAAGKIFLECGELESGLQHLEKATRLNPAHGGAYQQIAMARKFSTADLPLVQRIEQALQQQLVPAQRASIHYALGKIYDDLSEPLKAFPHFAQANLLQKPASKPAPPRTLFRQMRKLFRNFPFSEMAKFSNASDTPVFIVGTPRSGSTLVEKILASHTQIATAGELTEIDTLADQLVYPKQPIHRNRDDWEKFLAAAMPLAQRYVSRLQDGGHNKPRVIDKQPGNYFYLGLICLLFPNARIIHTTRHPLDAGLSCYFQSFEHVTWSTDLSWIAEHYHFYRDVMDFWQETLPAGKIMSVAYEQLVADPETHGRQLIEFLGLSWEPACLDFHQEKRAVRTASLWQVQQPIYQSSRGRWEAYAPNLATLAREIHPYLTPEDLQVFTRQGLSVKPGSLDAARRWLKCLLHR